MSWLNPKGPKTGTGESVPKKRSYRAVKPKVKFLPDPKGRTLPKPKPEKK